MKKVLLAIKKNYLAFSYTDNENSSNLINTNVISDNELIFSDDYIINNNKIVSLFIHELCLQYNITKISLEKNELSLLVLNLFKKDSKVRSLYLFEEQILSYTICEKLLKLKNFTYLNCYNIPNFMIEMLDQNNIQVISRNEILFTSDFMEINNLNQFSKIFYKISVRIKSPISDNDLEDFLTFSKINKYLKFVHLENLNLVDLEKITKILIENKLTHVTVLIHDNINDEKLIEYLKEQKKKVKKNKIIYKLVYSEEYLEKNIVSQTLVNILKVCGLIMTGIVLMVSGYIFISNYQSMKEVSTIKEDLKEVIKENENKEIIEEINNNNEGLVVKNEYIASLLSINPDTVGWLKINNTNIDYPVVQAFNNDYYLENNYYKEKDRNGWVFMDYRNEGDYLDKNTILYGHNRYSSGIMFGPLMDTIYKSWYTNPDNQIITFDTLYESMKWKIFSIYKVKVTTDYLRVTFSTNEKWQEFINLIKGRSVYDFKVNIEADDKIITLSTCTNNRTMRLVVHAVLIK